MEDFYQKDKNGILIWNPAPGEDEEVLWEGASDNGFAQGFGKLTWYHKGVVVSVYDGNMANGKPDGKGSYLFADGDSYTGTWKDGLRHGQGIHTYKDGRQKEGTWEYDQFEGAS